MIAASHSTAPPDYIHARQSLLLLIAAHVITMTLFATIARLPGAIWDDMLEAWAWGQQFQLGYYKHPPLYGWVAASGSKSCRARMPVIMRYPPSISALAWWGFGVSPGYCCAGMPG